jgi:ketosteroid isomerase-like protein
MIYKNYFMSILIVIFSFLSISTVNADDISDVEAVIDRYIKSQTLENMNTQAQLMAKDRTYIVNGTRYSNNDISMALQTANNAVVRKANPGIERISTAEDIHIRMNGDTAIVSFYLIMNDINNAANVKAGQPAMMTNYATCSMALFKIDGDWKIVHTHFSPTK